VQLGGQCIEQLGDRKFRVWPQLQIDIVIHLS
jgi:hypothetical protein